MELENLFQAPAEYWQKADLASQWSNLLLLLLITTISIWFVAWIISRLDTQVRWFHSRAFNLYRGWYLASLFVLAIIIALVAYNDCAISGGTHIPGWSALTPFNLLIVILGITIASFYFYKIWATTTRSSLQYRIAPTHITRHTQFEAHKLQKKQLLNWRFALLLPAACFLFMIKCLLKEERVFLAIVLDNSASMEEPINNGKRVLAESLALLEVESEYIVTTLQRSDTKDMSQIMAQNSPEQMAGISRRFYSNTDAISYIESDYVKAESINSPVVEATWKTFLMSVDESSTPLSSFDKKALIVVTDGDDNVEDFTRFLCDDEAFNQAFTPQDVLFVDVHKDDGQTIDIPLFQTCLGCGFTIGSGKDYESYADSVLSLVDGIAKKPPFLTIWAGIFFLIFCVANLTTSPSKID